MTHFWNIDNKFFIFFLSKAKSKSCISPPSPLFLHIEIIARKQKAPIFTGAFVRTEGAPKGRGNPH